jgi:predicted DCC family thiol-disulfide oxidoreductase YuxK
VIARHHEVAGVDALLWVEPPVAGSPERVLARSEAALRVAAYLGGLWRVALVGAVVPRPLRDALYDLVARHRHRLVAPPTACYAPPAEVRSRFLDARDPEG